MKRKKKARKKPLVTVDGKKVRADTVGEALRKAGIDLESGKFDPDFSPVTKEGWFDIHPATGKMVEVVTAEWALSEIAIAERRANYHANVAARALRRNAALIGK